MLPLSEQEIQIGSMSHQPQTHYMVKINVDEEMREDAECNMSVQLQQMWNSY